MSAFIQTCGASGTPIPMPVMAPSHASPAQTVAHTTALIAAHTAALTAAHAAALTVALTVVQTIARTIALNALALNAG